ncbi:MAG: hypothetical protein DSM106950_16765 [Stigonema ocellatum SAG 48.90 = DSM 106950]|nr:hypothetical protein [Stigonema ocellatum SAG 48.90 = DSM 106950]
MTMKDEKIGLWDSTPCSDRSPTRSEQSASPKPQPHEYKWGQQRAIAL